MITVDFPSFHLTLGAGYLAIGLVIGLALAIYIIMPSQIDRSHNWVENVVFCGVLMGFIVFFWIFVVALGVAALLFAGLVQLYVKLLRRHIALVHAWFMSLYHNHFSRPNTENAQNDVG